MMIGTKAAKTNEGNVNATDEGKEEVRPVKLGDHLFWIRKDLLQCNDLRPKTDKDVTWGISRDERGQALPKLEVTIRQLGAMIERQGLSLGMEMVPHGPLTDTELAELDIGENEGKYPGLRHGYKVEAADGESQPQYILLIATSMGGRSGMLTGQSPMIRIIPQPGYPLINVRSQKAKSKGAKLNGRAGASVQAVV